MTEKDAEQQPGPDPIEEPRAGTPPVQREIAKIPETPPFSDPLIGALTGLCFSEDRPEKADLLFVFGSNVMQKELAGLITTLLKQKLAKTVMITGGIANYLHTPVDKRPESEAILAQIPTEQFPSIRFLTETRSRNSLENILEAGKLYPIKKEETILFLSHAHASGRSRLTLKKICPGNKLISLPYEVPMGPGQEMLRRSDWWKYSQGRSMVWGEFLRILKYGERGDIPIREVLHEINNIRKLSGM
ncbi:MAG: ElyC/SanA/YdcF family protein [Puia sp.]|nr:ElyC/SanA/YdcF family protein [Puia sp.]